MISPFERRTLPSMIFELGVFALILSVIFQMTSRSLADPDLWGHLKFGKDMLIAGKVSLTDPYSYLTSGQEWIDHEWLTEVFFAKAFAVAGSAGLIALKLAIALLIAGTAFLHCRRQELSPLRAGLVVLLLFAPMFVWLQTIRAQLFTYLGLFALLLAIHRCESARHEALWGVPLLFVGWANLHGGFLAGIGVYYVWAAVTLVEKTFKARSVSWLAFPQARPFLFASVLSLPATFVTPYGPKLWAMLLRTATIPRPDVVEWVGLHFWTMEGACYLVLLTSAIMIVTLEYRRTTLARIAVLAVAAIAPLFVARHLPLFALTWGVLLPGLFSAFYRRWPERVATGRERIAVGIASAVGALLLTHSGIANLGCIGFGAGHGLPYPVGAVEYLKSHAIRGNLAVHFNWGEYVIYHLGPDIKVSVDGRRETVYSDPVYLENLRLTYGEGDWEALLRRPDTQLALFPIDSAPYRKLKGRSDWNLWHEDEVSALFSKKTLGSSRSLSGESEPSLSRSCFP